MSEVVKCSHCLGQGNCTKGYALSACASCMIKAIGKYIENTQVQAVCSVCGGAGKIRI